jgi:general secretion pathway protein D
MVAEPLCAESAHTFFKRGQAAESREDYDAAYENFSKAAAKAPKDLEYRSAVLRARVPAAGGHLTKGRKLADAGDETGAMTEFLHAAEIDPSNEAAQQEIRRLKKRRGAETPQVENALPEIQEKLDEVNSISEPAELKPVSNEPLTLHMTEDAKTIYLAVGKAAGINVLFDPEYNAKRVQVDLNGVSLLDALRILGTLSNTFWRPVTENTIFVAQNTRAKRTELDQQAVQTFYLSNAWQQNDLTDVQTAIRNVLPQAKAFAVASQNAIVMRGSPDELLLAQKLINDLDKARPEVVVDIGVLEVSKSWERTLGLQWPSSVSLALQSTTTDSSGSSTTTTSTTPTLTDLANLKGANVSVTVGSATLNLLLSDSNTKILQNPRIRATDQQKATMKIGSRIPVATGSYSSGTSTSTVSSLVNTQFQYQDVGVNIEMTPTVHYDRDVTLKIKIEVTSHSGDQTISGVTEPIISQRTIDQVVRLREGEASIMGGIQDQQDKLTWTGLPGLSSIPILKYFFGSKDHTISDDELVFVLVPHVVRGQTVDAINLRTVDTGSGQTVDLRRLSKPDVLQPAVTPKPAAPRVRPAANQHSNIGTVPGGSAMSAAPAAIEQMRHAGDATTNPAPQAVAQPQAASPAAKALLMMPPLPAAVEQGAEFKVPVVMNGAADVASVPLEIRYDASKLELTNVDQGDLLGRDGQAVTLVHRDDGPGTLVVNVSRPPGAQGVNGAGVVCVLSFRAKTAGNSLVVITRPAALNSAQQPLTVEGGSLSVQVR